MNLKDKFLILFRSSWNIYLEGWYWTKQYNPLTQCNEHIGHGHLGKDSVEGINESKKYYLDCQPNYYA